MDHQGLPQRTEVILCLKSYSQTCSILCRLRSPPGSTRASSPPNVHLNRPLKQGQRQGMEPWVSSTALNTDKGKRAKPKHPIREKNV
eukprot:5620455-Amphidinium_carterae.1